MDKTLAGRVRLTGLSNSKEFDDFKALKDTKEDPLEPKREAYFSNLNKLSIKLI
jgi:hypothetical protein